MKLDPRRRFRDRLLVGMVAVALLPLAAFAVLAAVDLDAISRSTANEAQGAILQAEQARQQSAEASDAGLLDARLDAINSELVQLSSELSRQLAGVTAGQTPANLAPERVKSGVVLVGGAASDPSVVVLSATASPDDARVIDASSSAAFLQVMQQVRRDYPEVTSVWVADRSGAAIRMAPGFNVQDALLSGGLDPAHPEWRAGADVFTASQQRLSAGDSSVWHDPTSARHGGAIWTDAYELLATGADGVTGWIPLHGGATMVGVDVSISSLVATVLASPNAPVPPPAAYPLLLSSDGRLLYAGSGAGADFSFTSQNNPIGSPLPLPPDRAFGTGLAQAEATGRPAVLPVQMQSVARDVFTAPVYGARWIFASPVPVSDLEPDISGLTIGIAAGVHRLFPITVLPALLLLLVVAFLIATVLSRRLVYPVRTLTKAAEQLATGRTETPVPPQGGDEVGVLAAALERMRVDINSSRAAILAAAAELEQRVAQRTRELRARNEELLALNELAGSLTRSLDTQLILQDALEAVRAIHPLRAGRGYVLDGDALSPTASWSADSGTKEQSEAMLDAVAADVIRSKHPVRRRGRAGLYLGWPLLTRQGLVGALAVQAELRPRPATQRLLQAVADQVALALRTSRLSAAGREHAVLEERTRLAREIHDTLAQQLTGIVIQLEAADALLERGSDRARQTVDVARDLARSALQEARRSVWNLRPAPLAATGLLGAMEREVRGWEAQSGIATRFRIRSVPARPALNPAAEVALLRIVQEALSNVARHSGASRVDIGMHPDAEELVMSVRDNGSGFDVAAQPPRDDCFGLEGMRERVRIAGGTFTVVSSPGAGTEVTVRFPLAEPGAVAHTA